MSFLICRSRSKVKKVNLKKKTFFLQSQRGAYHELLGTPSKMNDYLPKYIFVNFLDLYKSLLDQQ